MFSGLSLPPQFSSGNLNEGDVVVGPLEGHGVPQAEGELKDRRGASRTPCGQS